MSTQQMTVNPSLQGPCIGTGSTVVLDLEETLACLVAHLAVSRSFKIHISIKSVVTEIKV